MTGCFFCSRGYERERVDRRSSGDPWLRMRAIGWRSSDYCSAGVSLAFSSDARVKHALHFLHG